MLMDFAEVCTAVQGTFLCDFSSYKGFDSVTTDSRLVSRRALFVPLRGAHQDGHTYIEAALQEHACLIFSDTAWVNDITQKKNIYMLCECYHAACIVVPHTLYALQHAAAAYIRRFPRLLKIGVTGSNGKTTTKEFLGSIFSQNYCTITNKGNLNSETGLPLSLFTVRQEHEVGIFELGMNRKNEIQELARILQPDIAVITNIGTAHIGILGSKDAIAEEKKHIFSFFTEKCAGFIARNDSYYSFLKEIPKGVIHTYDTLDVQYTLNGLSGTDIVYNNTTIHIQQPGVHNVHNAFAAIAVAEYCGIPLYAIKQGLEQAESLFGRCQIIRAAALTYLLDCYNANFDSMCASISFCDGLAIENEGRKIYILASMKELGLESQNIHYTICTKALESSADVLFFFGSEICMAALKVCTAQKKDGQKIVFCFKEEEACELGKTLDAFLKKSDFVLLKGSRSLALEQFEDILKKER